MKRREVFLNYTKMSYVLELWRHRCEGVPISLFSCIFILPYNISFSLSLSLSVSLVPIVVSIYPPIRLLDIFASFYLSDSITEFLGRYSVDDIFPLSDSITTSILVQGRWQNMK